MDHKFVDDEYKMWLFGAHNKLRTRLDEIENFWSFSSHFQLSLEGDPEFIGFDLFVV